MVLCSLLASALLRVGEAAVVPASTPLLRQEPKHLKLASTTYGAQACFHISEMGTMLSLTSQVHRHSELKVTRWPFSLCRDCLFQ